MNIRKFIYMLVFVCLFFSFGDKVMASSYQCIYSKDSRTITLIKDADSLKATHSYKGNGITSYLLWDIDASSGYKQDVIFIMEGDKCPKYAYYFPEFYFNEQIYPHVIYFGKFDSFYLGGANTTEILSLAKKETYACSNIEPIFNEELTIKYNHLLDIQDRWENGSFFSSVEEYNEAVETEVKDYSSWIKDYESYIKGQANCSFSSQTIEKYNNYKKLLDELENDAYKKYLSENCSDRNLQSNSAIKTLLNNLKHMEKKLKDGIYYKNSEDYYEELDNHESKLNLLKDNHRRRGCSFTKSNTKLINEAEEQISKLRKLNPDDELPACEYLGVETVALIQKVFSIIKIFVPILLILLGSVDLSRAVLAGDEKDMKMAQKSLLQRFLAGVGIYFLPAILNLVLKLAGITGGTCNIG